MISRPDLSKQHHPVTSLFDVLADSQFDSFRLSEDQLAHFEQHGYVAGIRLFDNNAVDQLRQELAELFDPNHPGNEYWHEYHSNESGDPNLVLFHALGAWRIQPSFHDLLWNPAFLIPASQLLQGSVRFWHDQLFCKPAMHGGNVAWHQDYSYWTRTTPLAHLTCWIGLDVSTRSNGCLQYIPGSHRWDLLPATGLAGDMDAIRNVLTESQWEAFNQPVYIEMDVGEASFHHPLLVHGSARNETQQPRRAAVLNVVRDGVKSQSDDPLLAGVPPISKGDRLDGQFFPLLFDADSQTVVKR